MKWLDVALRAFCGDATQQAELFDNDMEGGRMTPLPWTQAGAWIRRPMAALVAYGTATGLPDEAVSIALEYVGSATITTVSVPWPSRKDDSDQHIVPAMKLAGAAASFFNDAVIACGLELDLSGVEQAADIKAVQSIWSADSRCTLIVTTHRPL